MSPKNKNEDESGGLSRRGFLKGAGLAAAAVGSGSIPAPAQDEMVGVDDVPIVGGEKTKIALTLNGKKVEIMVNPASTLLELIRGPLDLTGTKQVCNRGSCGACTVVLNDRAVCACSYLAIDAHGKNIQTVEGLANGDQLNPLQESFVRCDALQCGFCTPGMLMSCTALLKETPKPNRDQVAAGISGNICRCGTYQNIFEAVAQTIKGGGK